MTTFNWIKSSPFGLRGMALAAVSASLIACSSNEPIPDEEPVQAPRAETTGSQDSFGETADPRLNDRGLLGIAREDRAMFLDPNNPLSTRVIYFEYDSSRISPQFSRALQAHANYLANHRGVSLRLEGHTDAPGSREYNVALGERRAESVEKAMVLAGAGGEQISTLSFGEERLAEQTAGANQQNRRVELIYVQQ